MATWAKISPHTPPGQRQTVVTAESGDRIDIEAILGYSATGVSIETPSSGDSIEYRINSLQRIRKWNESTADTIINKWSSTSPVYTLTGSTQYRVAEGLAVGSFEVVSLSGTTEIEIVIW